MDKIWRDKQKEIRNKNREKISNARNQIETPTQLLRKMLTAKASKPETRLKS